MSKDNDTLAARIESSMAALNAAYLPGKVQFVLESIVYPTKEYQNTTVYMSGPTDGTVILGAQAKAKYFKDPEKVLNIGLFSDIRSQIGDPPKKLLGSAIFPHQAIALTSTGGLVINDYAIYNGGFTHVHEIGHCLGLYHTFTGDDFVDGKGKPASCDVCGDHAGESTDFKGDLISDTPPTNENYNCTDPVSPDCEGNHFVNSGYKNFMGYAGDVCLRTGGYFTPLQFARIRCSIYGYLTGWLVDESQCDSVADCTDSSSCTTDKCIEGTCVYSDACGGTTCEPSTCIDNQCVTGSCLDYVADEWKNCIVSSCTDDVCSYDYRTCDVKATNDCCYTSQTPSCNDPVLSSCVCQYDSSCCTDKWDDSCVDTMAAYCEYDCYSLWITALDGSKCTKALPIYSGWLYFQKTPPVTAGFQCDTLTTQKWGGFFLMKGIWPDGTTVTVNACRSVSEYTIAVFDTCGTPSAPASCISRSSRGSDAKSCTHTFDLEYGTTYYVLLSTFYYSSISLDITYSDPTPPLKDVSLNWPALLKLADTMYVPITNLLEGPNIVQYLLPWNIVDDWDVETGVFTTYYKFIVGTKDSQIQSTFTSLATKFEDFLRLACHYENVDCGNFKLAVHLPNGFKKRQTSEIIVFWIFEDLHEGSDGATLGWSIGLLVCSFIVQLLVARG